jgi:hypothetical protein
MGEAMQVWEQEYMGDLCTSSQFCCEPTHTLKNSLWKKKKNQTSLCNSGSKGIKKERKKGKPSCYLVMKGMSI